MGPLLLVDREGACGVQHRFVEAVDCESGMSLADVCRPAPSAEFSGIPAFPMDTGCDQSCGDECRAAPLLWGGL